MKPEQQLQNQICDFLRIQYPNVLFMVSASGFNTDNRKGKQLARMQNPSKGWPDLFIAKVKLGFLETESSDTKTYSGLFIELKPEGTVIYNKDGSLRKNEHLQEQDKVHSMLHARGYKACFSIGFDATKKLIDWYLA